jgi:excinuclease ABC subunit C
VRIQLPARGEGRRLLQVVTQNAKQDFVVHKLKRASDFAARSRALAELGDVLGLPLAPLRIECYDISNLGPTDKVGSMVVFEDGLPKRSDYRKFEIKGVAGQDDFASMEEVLRRRFARLVREDVGGGSPAAGDASLARAHGLQSGQPHRAPGLSPDVALRGAPAAGRSDEAESDGRHPTGRRSGRGRRFAYPPALIVVDGGRGQLSVAERVLADHGFSIPAIGLAKRLEEVYLPGQPEPLIIPRGSEALFVLQHIRDEAHRFAITYHRAKRAKRALRSALDDIPGVGEVRKKALLRRFGSVARMRMASEDELAATRGVGPGLARTVFERLHSLQVADNERRAG